MAKPRKKKSVSNVIARNKRARFDYFIEEQIEAGIALEGWEVKSIREGRVQLNESYVALKKGEIWLIGAHISALPSASTHIAPEPTRDRKLLIHRRELDRLTGAVERRGYTIATLDMHWSRGRTKLSIGLAKGKRLHDKRASERERDWSRERERLLKTR